MYVYSFMEIYLWFWFSFGLVKYATFVRQWSVGAHLFRFCALFVCSSEQAGVLSRRLAQATVQAKSRFFFMLPTHRCVFSLMAREASLTAVSRGNSVSCHYAIPVEEESQLQPAVERMESLRRAWVTYMIGVGRTAGKRM